MIDFACPLLLDVKLCPPICRDFPRVGSALHHSTILRNGQLINKYMTLAHEHITNQAILIARAPSASTAQFPPSESLRTSLRPGRLNRPKKRSSFRLNLKWMANGLDVTECWRECPIGAADPETVGQHRQTNLLWRAQKRSGKRHFHAGLALVKHSERREKESKIIGSCSFYKIRVWIHADREKSKSLVPVEIWTRRCDVRRPRVLIKKSEVRTVEEIPCGSDLLIRTQGFPQFVTQL